MNGARPRSSLLLILPGMALFIVAICWPAMHGISSMIAAPAIDPELLTGGVWARTVGWSLAVTLVALVPGLIAAGLLAPLISRRRGARIAAALCLAPLVVPGYAVFWCWWQALGPGTWIGDLALDADAAVWLREGVLLASMACWAWPLVAWPVALVRAGRSRPMLDLAALDGVSGWRRLGLRFRAEWTAILLGCALVAFVTVGSTISFDLAQVATVGFELRALDAVGASPGALLRASLPSVLLAVAAAALLLAATGRAGVRWEGALARRATRADDGPLRWLLLSLLVGATALLPLGLAFSSLGSLDMGQFLALHSGATMRTMVGAVVDGLLGAILAGSLLVQLSLGGPVLQRLGKFAAVTWIGVAFVPSITICAAVTSAFNTTLLGPLVYDTGIALILGHLLRSGGVACLVVLLVHGRSVREGHLVRRLDPPRLRALSPELRTVASLAFGICLILSLGELVVTGRLSPPGDDRIATTLLNSMHYQRPDSVLFALAGLAVAGWGGALLLVSGVPIGRAARGSSPACVCIAVLLMTSCGQPSTRVAEESGDPVAMLVGAPGRGDGLFQFPRGIAFDQERNRFYVVDKTARVQVFSSDGELLLGWRMPEWTVGKPVGISIAPDGRVFVPDTHYHRIIVYDPEGRELERHGSFGTGPGEFVYPTDIAFGPEGLVFVSEYGTNDRIQVFDADWNHVRSFGRFGREHGEFARPQSIALCGESGELYVADTCNHRVGVFTLEGEWLRSLGGPGADPGRLSYPHGLELLPDGTLLVSEIGTDRIQRLDPRDGRSLGVWGASGFRMGELRTPWGVASDGEHLLVLDSGNSRVQVTTLSSIDERRRDESAPVGSPAD